MHTDSQTPAPAGLEVQAAKAPPLLVDLIGDDQAAQQLGVSEATLARWRRAGRGPRFCKIGRRVFYRTDAIRTWAAGCEYGSTAESKVKRKAGGAP